MKENLKDQTKKKIRIDDLERENWCIFNSNDSSNASICLGSETESAKPFDFDQKDIFGYISYDFKNQIEELKSENPSSIPFLNQLFVPIEKNIKISHRELEDLFFDHAQRMDMSASPLRSEGVVLKSRTDKQSYFEHFKELQWHIQRGDIYEINYCLEWFTDDVFIDPILTYKKLNDITKAPFSALLKTGDQFVICASPERFIKKRGNRLISQPIKGTIKRGDNEQEDLALLDELTNNLKERAENIMTTDVVRNDFSRIAQKASVHVPELAQAYSFQTVHHLISTIECSLYEQTKFADIIGATFPMPSMTGAPKISAMKIIERLENFKRGLYSGCIGYIDDKGDFDFNVVIRSILYDRNLGRISVPVGSAITSKSDPEKEWDECLVKKEAMQKALL